MLRPACFKLVSAVALSVLIAFMAASAQTAPTPKYDKSSEVKVKGTIDEVITGTDKDSTVHVMVTTDKGPIDVLVAPEKFLKDMEITLAKGETIEVTGSQVTVDGKPVMLAREVIRSGDVMAMRDDKGKPVWLGWPK
jgi:hypothetical protein